jgi:phenylacetate-CoA ligase
MFLRPGLRSTLPAVHWPAVPANPAAAIQLGLLYQLDASQWWKPEELEQAQLRQLGAVLAFAASEVPYYRDRIENREKLDLSIWRTLPILTRRDIQDAGDALKARRLPRGHGRTYVTQTSGSTGQPVKVLGTELTRLFWKTLTIREHLWHGRDLGAKLCAIRMAKNAEGPHGRERMGWGPATDDLVKTGPIAALSLKTDVGVQAQWLARHDPEYLLSYPSNLLALARRFRQDGLRLARLREVRTIGETVTPELVQELRETWGAPVTDLYSSQEVGYIALQCPSGSGLYHLQSEALLVEILGEDGNPCPPGAIGRVVVSTLHNFAMPLIRYDMRDYAEAGPACPCGRGLPTVRRVLGRRRNMLVLPSGEQRWPVTGFMKYREIAPIRQYQLVQLDVQTIEVRLVADRAVTPSEEKALTSVIQQHLGHPFRLRFAYLDAFPPHPGGKFEDFVSLL